MYHQDDDPNSGAEENLVNQSRGRCPSDVLILKKVEDDEAENNRLKLGYINTKMKGIEVPQRWIFAVMGCLAITNAYMMRVCLSLAITEMVTKAETASNHTSLDDTCPTTTESTLLSSSSSGTYEWSEYMQGIILSSFFWGYTITHVPGGLIAEKFGGKHTLGLGVLSTAIFTLLTPLVVQTYDSTGLIILRVLIGFGEGTTFPAISVLISEWAPPLERSKIGSLVMSGMSLGIVIGNAFAGVLIRYSSIGWPIIFYVFGSLGVLWFLAWVLLCYNNPDVHPFISEKEKEYLRRTISNHTKKKTHPTPWRHILTSVPVWALLVAKVGNTWGYQMLASDLPKYMSSVLKLPIQMNGFLSAVPYVLACLVAYPLSWLADWLMKEGKVSRTNVRKILNSIATIIPGISLIAASYAGCDRTIVVICLIFGIGMTGAMFSSIMVNPNDLSPNYSGTLMAFGNSLSALAGIAAPYAVGVLTPNQTLLEWRIVFWISFAIYGLTALIFVVWADGEVQYWNNLCPEVDHEKKLESSRLASEDPSPFKQTFKLSSV